MINLIEGIFKLNVKIEIKRFYQSNIEVNNFRENQN